MAEDEVREAEALEWSEAAIVDMSNEKLRLTHRIGKVSEADLGRIERAVKVQLGFYDALADS
jgi:hypothetical protein